jgi:hypothetical protein
MGYNTHHYIDIMIYSATYKFIMIVSTMSLLVTKVIFFSIKEGNLIITHHAGMADRAIRRVITFDCDYARTFFLFFLTSWSHDVIMMMVFLFHVVFNSPLFFLSLSFLICYSKGKKILTACHNFTCLSA